MKPGLMRVKEVADYLSVSRATVYRLLERDIHFPRSVPFSIGQSRWHSSDWDNYVASLDPTYRQRKAT